VRAGAHFYFAWGCFRVFVWTRLRRIAEAHLHGVRGAKSLKAEADTLQEQDVGDALHRAAPDDRKYAQLVSVVEHGSEIGTELHLGAADRSRDQRDCVGVQRLLGGAECLVLQLTEPPFRIRRAELGSLLIPNPRRCRIG
jgi:hypothetical protein